MAKLNVAILDNDKLFMSSVADYLQKKDISVSSFSNQEKFLEWLEEYTGSFDVLLVSQDWAEHEYGSKIRLKIIMASDEDYESDTPAIFKFQPGERLLENIYRIMSHGKKKSADKSKTKMLGVFSASGGAGKSVIAAAICRAAADKGLNVFYLGMEDMPSSGLFFHGQGKRNMSYVFYNIKNKATNMSYRIEQTRCIDEHSKVHFICPPESAQEFFELSPDELQTLFGEFKATGYDLIVVDLPAGLNSITRAASEICDKMLYVIEDSVLGWHKYEVLVRETNLLKLSGFVTDRIIAVINKLKSNNHPEVEYYPVYRIPVLGDLFVQNDEGNTLFYPSRELLNTAHHITQQVFKG